MMRFTKNIKSILTIGMLFVGTLQARNFPEKVYQSNGTVLKVTFLKNEQKYLCVHDDDTDDDIDFFHTIIRVRFTGLYSTKEAYMIPRCRRSGDRYRRFSGVTLTQCSCHEKKLRRCLDSTLKTVSALSDRGRKDIYYIIPISASSVTNESFITL